VPQRNPLEFYEGKRNYLHFALKWKVFSINAKINPSCTRERAHDEPISPY